ncbi:triose-phosphate transporter family-domain-containing protein [Polychytrium aggregatum]|uniref:triose-phosphate transporter family-domain-containing protein n=1 Tax=Polychytrium aggregatum TaxID=110093 RepID=UPI0022FE581A|nr:triose-phosphate transporter family-domain-containing protein [Polychytrium aggregatum]KAI9199696.1 triose-phosphate transporter family-domain-containing protein [Polychytrium aggregatum]
MISYLKTDGDRQGSYTKFILTCLAWYLASVVQSNLTKLILNAFAYPVTVTFVQFGFVMFWMLVTALIPGQQWIRLRTPSVRVFATVLPLSGFQIMCHLLSSISLARIPVSIAHTIKAGAPLITVFIYRTLFGITYQSQVYQSLIPLTLGLVFVCMNKLTFDLVGYVTGMAATTVFVMQNIFTKKLFVAHKTHQDLPSHGRSSTPSEAVSSKPWLGNLSLRPVHLDEMNVLFYTSVLSTLFMSPIWLYSDGALLLQSTVPLGKETSAQDLLFMFVLNGFFHFLQTLFAFLLLAQVSPVTYSVASLFKRVAVISVSIVYFGDKVTFFQTVGIGLTFYGLWLYDRAKAEVAKGEARLVSLEASKNDGYVAVATHETEPESRADKGDDQA